MKLKGACIIVIIFLFSIITAFGAKPSFAQMPFYDLKPKDIVVKSRFQTSYSLSSIERKNNIKLASKSINNYFLDVGAEFSFNRVVGQRTEKRGYQNAKIISQGKFVDGVGGGVCQVSTTLYNAVLLADLEITEWHPHSLPVSYVLPSFDAMVNSNTADLRFVNNTKNPIVINSFADNDKIEIIIYGEQNKFLIERKSEVVNEIIAPKEEVVEDIKNEYPNLFEGEERTISYSKNGLVSRGYVIKKLGAKIVSSKKIREDKYSAYRGLIIKGRVKRPEENLAKLEEEKIISQKLINHKKYFDKYRILC